MNSYWARFAIGRAALLALCALIPGPTQAATIERKGDSVVVTGRFERGDLETFRRIVQDQITKDTVIVFETAGGLVGVGLEMGEFIRMRGLATFVGPDKVCASACAIVWLAGNPRGAATTARIGFHAAYDQQGMEKGEPNAMVGAFLTRIGLSYEAVRYVTRAPPKEMQWLKFDDAERLRIDVVRVTPEEFEKLVKPSTPPSVAAPAPAPAPTPAPAPAPAAPEQSLEDKALWSAIYHRVAWSTDLPTDWNHLRSFYADQVVYHEKQMTGDEVIIAKKKFAERTPTRSYKIRGNPVISCVGPICDVKGVMDWHTVDRKGDAEGGTAYLAYRLRWTGTKNEILLETSKVVASRKVAAPTVPTPAPPGKVIERQAQPRTGKQQGSATKLCWPEGGRAGTTIRECTGDPRERPIN